MLVIDGAGGGGQILRTAVSYSAVSGYAVRVVNIRAGRPSPGLQAQHLLAVTAVAQLCGARVSGASPGSLEIEFHPGPIDPPLSWCLELGTAGSVMLVLQALLPCLALAPAPSEIVLTGGTNNPWAPPFEYLRWVLIPMLARMGMRIEADLVRRGFYPRGGGEVRLRTWPADGVKPLVLRERGKLVRLWGIAYSANLPQHIARRMSEACRGYLAAAGLTFEPFTSDTATPSPGAGCGIIAIAEFEHMVLAADALGERGKPAEEVGRAAAEALLRDLGTDAAVDAHLADQLVAWTAVAGGESTYLAPRQTAHLASAARVAEQVLGARFAFAGQEPLQVSCRGVGSQRRQEARANRIAEGGKAE